MISLSPRQTEVLKWRLMGFHTKGIADAMKVTSKTVEYHWSMIKQKLGLQDVVEICCWFCRSQKGISPNTVASNNAGGHGSAQARAKGEAVRS